MAAKRFTSVGTIFMFIIIAAQLTGCAAVVVGGAAGAGTVVYVKGELHEDINAPATRVHHASVLALRELELPVIENNHDRQSAKMKSKFSSGEDIWIDIESVTAESSKVTIRVGLMGDENKARIILDKIHRNL